MSAQGRSSVLNTMNVRRFIYSFALCSLLIGAAKADEIVTFDVIRAAGSSSASVERRSPLREVSPLVFKPGDRVELRTEEGHQLDLTIQRVNRSTLGNYIIRTHDPFAGKSIIVIDSEGRALGSVETAGASYEIFTTPEGKLLLREKNRSGIERPIDFGAVEKPREREAQNNINLDVSAALSEQPAREAKAAQADGEEVVYPRFQSGGAVLSILMYYDDSMSDATSRIDFVTAVANDAFRASNTDITINIVATKAVSIDDEATLSEVLSAMGEAEPPFENIQDDRSRYSVDLVYAIKDSEPDDEDSCGVAYRGFPS